MDVADESQWRLGWEGFARTLAATIAKAEGTDEDTP